jgi:hypothetical protein
LFQYRDQSGLPVVTVDHVPRGESVGQLRGSLAEENESLGIVRVISVGVAVETLPQKIRIGPNEIRWDFFPEERLENGAARPAAGKGRLDLQTRLCQSGDVLQDGAIGRQNQGDFAPETREGSGESADGVRQPSGLRQGKDLR